jgi:hypothetical protein
MKFRIGRWLGAAGMFMILVGLALGIGRIDGGKTSWQVGRAAANPDSRIYLPLVVRAYQAPAPLWRFGAAIARRRLLDYPADQIIGLRLGWYVDWTVTPNAPQPYGIEYIPIVRLKQWKVKDGVPMRCCAGPGCEYLKVNGQYTYTVSPSLEILRQVAQERPGLLWVIGNEIERVDWETSDGGCAGQDEMLPEVYAEAYHEIREAIRAIDPTARFAIGGVVQFTPLRRQYLQRVWDAYRAKYGRDMPVDVWNVHVFILQEKKGEWGADIPAGIESEQGILYTIEDNKRFELGWQQLLSMRQWMKEIGQQNKPLIITEYGVNMPPHYSGFSYEEVKTSFMYPSFDQFLNYKDCNLGYGADECRLIQRWNWYSLDDDSGRFEDGEYHQFYNGNLLYSGLGGQPQGISPLGIYWREYVRGLSSEGGRPSWWLGP